VTRCAVPGKVSTGFDVFGDVIGEHVLAPAAVVDSDFQRATSGSALAQATRGWDVLCQCVVSLCLQTEVLLNKACLKHDKVDHCHIAK